MGARYPFYDNSISPLQRGGKPFPPPYPLQDGPLQWYITENVVRHVSLWRQVDVIYGYLAINPDVVEKPCGRADRCPARVRETEVPRHELHGRKGLRALRRLHV